MNSKHILVIAAAVTLTACAEQMPEVKTTSKPSATSGSDDRGGRISVSPDFPTPVVPAPAPAPSPANTPPPAATYDWTIYSVNNLPNGRGIWTSTIAGARPGAAIYVKQAAVFNNGQRMPLYYPNYFKMAAVPSNGIYIWDGPADCPATSHCTYSWDVMIDNTVKRYSILILPE